VIVVRRADGPPRPGAEPLPRCYMSIMASVVRRTLWSGLGIFYDLGLAQKEHFRRRTKKDGFGPRPRPTGAYKVGGGHDDVTEGQALWSR
jgi:hypothetical protein